jgi:uncharacterized protein
MARTTYLAPGVYVEEIPSAQQPIAGVGTNTVGFVGVVGSAIYYPVREELYDPVVARAVLSLRASQQDKASADAKDVERNQAIAKAQLDRMDAEVKGLEERLAAADKAVQEIGADPSRATERERAAATSEGFRKQRDDLVKARQDLQRAQQTGSSPAAGSPPAGESADRQDQLTEPSVLRPYRLVKFDVEIEPFDTKLCTNFSEYTSMFGPFSADDFNARPGTALDPGHRALTHAVYGFFKNGGTRCFVARITEKNAEQLDKALLAMESIDAVAIVAAPGIDGLDAWGKLIAHCDTTEDRFAILDCPEAVEGESKPAPAPTRPPRGGAAAATAGAGAAGAPTTGELNIKLLSYETPGNVLPPRAKNAAFYFPYIEVVDPAKQVQDEDPARQVPLKYRGRVYVPPSGHIAGIYARTDEQRGVHKAPANATVMGAVDLKYYVSKPKQELLNPQGVNCIRDMSGNIAVWGARTIGGDRNAEWKYINVRRFFLFLRESIDEGTQWVVFEPNDPTLWGKIRLNVSAFLTNVWRTGALFGVTPQEAFYVKCDAETNPPEVRDVGMVVTEIGVAIVRPAEFVIFRITQSTGLRQG